MPKFFKIASWNGKFQGGKGENSDWVKRFIKLFIHFYFLFLSWARKFADVHWECLNKWELLKSESKSLEKIMNYTTTLKTQGLVQRQFNAVTPIPNSLNACKQLLPWQQGLSKEGGQCGTVFLNMSHAHFIWSQLPNSHPGMTSTRPVADGQTSPPLDFLERFLFFCLCGFSHYPGPVLSSSLCFLTCIEGEHSM